MKKVSLFLILVLIVFLAKFCWAIDPASENNLKAFLTVSDSPEYIENWVKKPSDTPIIIKKVTAFIPNETVYIAFIATGFGVKNDGRIDLHADIEIIKPNGEILFSLQDYSKATGHSSKKPCFVMLDPALDLIFDNTDPQGIYILKAIISDGVSTQTATATEKIMLVSSTKLRNLLRTPINDAKILDDLWLYYFETHNLIVINRIISVLHWVKDGSGMQIVVGGAAKWSLTSNAKQHSEIFDYLVKEIQTSFGITKSLLEEIIEEAQNN